MKEEKKSKKISWATIVIILLIVVGAGLFEYIFKSQTDSDVMRCIGNNSILVASRGCGHCRNQIEMLGDVDNFNIIYCDDDGQFCIDNQITGVPTWIINEERFVGVRAIDELKELTGC